MKLKPTLSAPAGFLTAAFICLSAIAFAQAGNNNSKSKIAEPKTLPATAAKDSAVPNIAATRANEARKAQYQKEMARQAAEEKKKKSAPKQ